MAESVVETDAAIAPVCPFAEKQSVVKGVALAKEALLGEAMINTALAGFGRQCDKHSECKQGDCG
jgi:hypothetical protein